MYSPVTKADRRYRGSKNAKLTKNAVTAKPIIAIGKKLVAL